MEVPKTIFRNYDIRGVYPDELNEEIALHIGRALGSVLPIRVRKYRLNLNYLVLMGPLKLLAVEQMVLHLI